MKEIQMMVAIGDSKPGVVSRINRELVPLDIMDSGEGQYLTVGEYEKVIHEWEAPEDEYFSDLESFRYLDILKVAHRAIRCWYYEEKIKYLKENPKVLGTVRFGLRYVATEALIDLDPLVPSHLMRT